MSQHTSLLVCPKNLKECIDWVLRATGRDNQKGSNNIVNLKDALNAVLSDFESNSNDLTQLVQGLCLFMGYPSCLCKPKKSVGESLEKISKELKEELKNYKCLLNSKPSLNCSSCQSNPVVCKCCVLDCILKVLNSGCECVKDSNHTCTCIGPEPKRCCKDLLEKLKASLSLLNLKADMEICKCPYDSNCCVNGKCTKVDSSKCPFCKTPNASKDYTVTGLGLLRPSPKRLAEKLNDFFGNGPGPKSCGCKGSPCTCCCLACDNGKCVKACSCGSPGQCNHQPPQECPCKDFCIKINSIKVLEKSSDMRCCDSGAQCHCQLDPSNKCQPGSSGKCCVVDDKSGSGSNFQQGVKCMIRRLVRFFKDLETSSKKFKSCCDLLCVAKTCYFLWDFYGKGKEGGKEKCSKCKSPGTCPGSTLTSGSSPSCCGGASGCQSGDCCQGCQDCDAIKFRKALQTLQYSGPCGHDLWRVLNDFLDCCFRIFKPEQKFVENKVKELQKELCQKCKDATKSGQPCTCSSGSSYSCLACFALFNDYELKARFISEYSSSYTYKFESVIDPPAKGTYASWNSLCASGSKCCSNPSCSCPPSCSSSNPSSCDPKDCCEKCPKRLCAKIFLGILPCLYYGLKILYDRCKYGSDFPDWYQKKFYNILVPASVLDASDLKKFLDAWGFGSVLNPSIQAMVLPGLLENLFSSESSGNFDKIYKEVSGEYFKFVSPSISSGSSVPSTVRQMLLWLYGLRFQKHFSDLVSHCSSLCSPFGKSFNADAFCYYIYTCSFIFPVAIISFIEDSSSAQKVFSSSSEWQNFSYPSDPSDLLDMLFEYLRKIFAALNFLCIQCKNDKDHAGWQDCAYGQGCAQALQSSLKSLTVSSGSSCCKSKGSHGILCTSKPGISNYHEHCTKPGVKCIGLKDCTDTTKDANLKDHTKDAHTSNQCTASCPHPLLMFLIDGSESQSKPQASSYSLFKLPDDSSVPPMGFSPDKLSSPGRNGRDLYDVLNSFCGSGYSPLTSLLRSLVCISRYPPESLGEFFLFFKKLAEALNSEPLKTEFPNYVTGEPGFYNGQNFTNALKDALEKLYGSSHSGSPHLFDLQSLIGCHANKASNATCGPYLYSLTGDVYDIFIDSPGMYLSWICYLPKDFKDRLEEFKQKFSKCCLNPSSGPCSSIVKCPCALPLIYSRGFQFMSPSGLGCVDSWGQEHGQRGNVKGHSDENSPDCTRRTCKNFIDQLGKVLGLDPPNASSDSVPLLKLLSEIEKFLWSIRKPFFFFVLAFWAFVISYFLYVQLY
ncbi:variant erythrocyte surface antigen-1 family protein, partial [Babesia divergens]